MVELSELMKGAAVVAYGRYNREWSYVDLMRRIAGIN